MLTKLDYLMVTWPTNHETSNIFDTQLSTKCIMGLFEKLLCDIHYQTFPFHEDH